MKMKKSLKLSNQQCPICNSQLCISTETISEPYVFCDNCEYVREPTDKELLQLLGFD